MVFVSYISVQLVKRNLKSCSLTLFPTSTSASLWYMCTVTDWDERKRMWGLVLFQGMSQSRREATQMGTESTMDPRGRLTYSQGPAPGYRCHPHDRVPWHRTLDPEAETAVAAAPCNCMTPLSFKHLCQMPCSAVPAYLSHVLREILAGGHVTEVSCHVQCKAVWQNGFSSPWSRPSVKIFKRGNLLCGKRAQVLGMEIGGPEWERNDKLQYLEQWFETTTWYDTL